MSAALVPPAVPSSDATAVALQATDAADVPSAPKAVAFFKKSFDVRWADCDANRHLRHSAYADYATDVRLSYLNERGWPMSRFGDESIGAVILREETRYKKEVHLGERIHVDFRVGHMSKCGRKWTVIQHITNDDGVECAVCTLDGMWLQLDTRRPVRPPADLHSTMTRIVDEDEVAKRAKRRRR